ncbi:MAG: UDP-N-acetylmuramate dehydrogenase [Candidatus Taylorbacteria bacterium]|nr:UDP-N-acetylmuramate dehydrogenase [Candidatus Taylorbacteria bacterium]
MKIQENISLAQYTTFKIGGLARYFCAVRSEDDLVEAVRFAKEKKIPIMVIGGGSNLLFSDAGFNGLIIRSEIKGMTFKDVGNDSVLIEANAGEDWDGLVEQVVKRGLYGVENLSSIPGTVGASPVQNIGAYGFDVSSAIESVRALDIETMDFVELKNGECLFSYRDSRFKRERSRFIITRVTYKFSKKGKVDASYKDLVEYFGKRKITDPTLKQVRQAVIEVRETKLPDWKSWGTAGSFFKNPIIDVGHFKRLKKEYPEIPGFPEADGRIKVPLGWIIDKVCNSKGLTIGNVSTYEKQALVVVARPGATATEVIEFANEIMRRVHEKTGIRIESEVEWAVA